jgi:hypothetical protein
MPDEATQIADGFYLLPGGIVELETKAGFERYLQLHHGKAIQVQVLG